MNDSERDAAILAVHAAWAQLALTLLEKGVLTRDDLATIRAGCLGVAAEFEAKPGTPQQVTGARVREWIGRLLDLVRLEPRTPP